MSKRCQALTSAAAREQTGVVPVVGGRRDELAEVLAEAGATPTGPCVEEAPSDAGIHPDGIGDVPCVRTDKLADVGDLVREADLQGEKGVGRVLDRFRGREAGAYERRPGSRPAAFEALIEDRSIHVLERLEGLGVVAAEHDAIRMEVVVDRKCPGVRTRGSTRSRTEPGRIPEEARLRRRHRASGHFRSGRCSS